MKATSIPMAVVCGLVLFTDDGRGAPQAAASQFSMGAIELRVGMPLARVLDLLGKEYQLKKSGETDWVVLAPREGKLHMLGSLFFKGDLLTGAAKDWTPSDGGDFAFGRSLYALGREFEQRGETTCTLETGANDAPDVESRALRFHCGRRTLSVHTTRLKGTEIVSIGEGIR